MLYGFRAKSLEKNGMDQSVMSHSVLGFSNHHSNAIETRQKTKTRKSLLEVDTHHDKGIHDRHGLAL